MLFSLWHSLEWLWISRTLASGFMNLGFWKNPQIWCLRTLFSQLKIALKGVNKSQHVQTTPTVNLSYYIYTYCKYHHSIVGLSVDIGCPVFFVGFPPWVFSSSIIKHLLQIQLHSQAHTLPTEGLHMFVSWEHTQEMVEFCPVRTSFIHLVILKVVIKWG